MSRPNRESTMIRNALTNLFDSTLIRSAIIAGSILAIPAVFVLTA